MAIEFDCPHCKQSLRVEKVYAGKKVDCPSCTASITIPKCGENLYEISLAYAPLSQEKLQKETQANQALIIELRQLLRIHEKVPELSKSGVSCRDRIFTVLMAFVLSFFSFIIISLLCILIESKESPTSVLSGCLMLTTPLIVFVLVLFYREKQTQKQAQEIKETAQFNLKSAVDDIIRNHPSIIEITGNKDKLFDREVVKDLLKLNCFSKALPQPEVESTGHLRDLPQHVVESTGYPRVPMLAIRFDIDALEAKHPDVSYGEAAWSIVDGAVDLSSLQGQSTLFEGDSLDNEYVFCIVFQNTNRSILDGIQTSMEASSEFSEVADSQPTLTDQDRGRIIGLSLVHNADINNGEINILVSTLLRSALAKRKEARSKLSSDRAHAPVPQRPSPASNRTASLPNFTSRDNLVSFLEQEFGVSGTYGAYVTPEELCDIVEKYRDATKAFLSESHDHGSEMQVHLLAQTDVDELFGNSQQSEFTDRGIRFGGLTEFVSHADAVNYCKNSIGDEGCVSAWAIQGKYALNFMIQSMFTEEIDPSRPVSADELWAEICMRRSSFKTTKSAKGGSPRANEPASKVLEVKNSEPDGDSEGSFNQSILFDLRRLLRLHDELDKAKNKGKSITQPLGSCTIGCFTCFIGMIVGVLISTVIFGEKHAYEIYVMTVTTIGGFVGGYMLPRMYFIKKDKEKETNLKQNLDSLVDEICNNHPVILEIIRTRERLLEKETVVDLLGQKDDDLNKLKFNKDGSTLKSTIPPVEGGDIFEAIKENDINEVKNIINKGYDVNKSDDSGYTPLYVAATYANKEIVELLISKGAEVNIIQKDRSTPLHGAAEKGNNEVAKLLILKRANVNAKKMNGFTPLHCAVSCGHKDMVELLISRGAEFNIEDVAGNTPMNIAMKEGKNVEIATLLRRSESKDSPSPEVTVEKKLLSEAKSHTMCVKCGNPFKHITLLGELKWACQKCGLTFCHTCCGMDYQGDDHGPGYQVFEVGWGNARCPFCDVNSKESASRVNKKKQKESVQNQLGELIGGDATREDLCSCRPSKMEVSGPSGKKIVLAFGTRSATFSLKDDTIKNLIAAARREEKNTCRKMGEQLYELGGWALMLTVCELIRNHIDLDAGIFIDRLAWDGLADGRWRG